ncbi:MAG: hypothetical protein JNM09_31360, partial [Blastocatellia bacterium]|nr:hypothetical protein [Blastocatellia bacterium]
MPNGTLEQVKEAILTLPQDDRKHLQRWLDEQARKDASQAPPKESLEERMHRYKQTQKWLQENRETYMGQWVALEGDRLVAHGADGLKVHAEAKAAGIEVPFLEHIVEEKE